MRTYKVFRLLLIFILTVVISGFGEKTGNRAKSNPQYSGEMVIPLLKSDVTVYRDFRGMPHIIAVDEHDLYLAVGYVMAQERLWQMDLIRRSSAGRLSEIFGKSFVKTDLFFRCLDITTKSLAVLNDEDPEILNDLQAFADGVNYFITSSGKKLPPEFRILSYRPEPWKLEDIANIIGLMGWGLGEINLRSELFNYRLIRKLGIEKGSELITDGKAIKDMVYPEFNIDDSLIAETESFISAISKYNALGIDAFSSSNSWAVSGKRSDTGKPLFANDMHLTLNSPGVWMQMHQVIPGKLNVTGVLIPGEPFIVGGHNENIAWGMTNLRVDDIDLFAEKINPENANQYYFNGEWKNMKTSNEIIKIKGGRQDTFNIKFTHHGPIISGQEDIKDISLSMKWAGQDKSDEIRSIYLMNRAENWDDFRSALTTFRAISQNFIYSDTKGNIGLNVGGGIAIRKNNMNVVRDGQTDEYDWKGYVPFEQLPFSFNPDNGYVSSANNKTVSDDYPYYINTFFALPYRINRIRQMLDEKEILNTDDFKRIVNDQHSDYAALLTPYIITCLNKSDELTSAESYALTALRQWDYDMNTELVAPSLFEYFRISFLRNLLADELGDLYSGLFDHCGEHYIYRILKNGPDKWVDNINTPEKESLEEIVLLSFRDCIKSLSDKYGKDQSNWKWGNLHKITFEHPLGTSRILNMLYGFNSKEYPVGGSDHTVKPFFAQKPGSGIDAGASERHIFNTADWDESFTIIPTGASGNPRSEFYLSQTPTYINGGFYRDPFSENAVRSSTKYILYLRPKSKN